MKTLIKIKLLDKNHIELREYELNKQELKVILCGSKNYKNCFHLDEPYQIMTLAQQKKGRITNTQQSKFPPYSYYRMVKFLWKPVKPRLVEEPVNLTEALTKLANTPAWKELGKKLHK